MRSFEILPHTADVRVRVSADSLAELHRGAVEGMAELLQPGISGRPGDDAVVVELDVPGTDVTARLVDLLSDVLTATFVEGAVFHDVTSLGVAANRVTATVRGTTNGSPQTDIKAVTYHGAEVVQTPDGTYHVTVVFDI